MSMITSSEAEPEGHLLAPLGERAAARRLDSVHRQMSAIQHRDRKEVDQPEVDGQHRREPDHRHHAILGDLARHLRDPERSAELLGGAAADDHLAKRVERAADQTERLADPFDHGEHRIRPPEFDPRSADADQADPVDLAEPVLDLGQLGRERQIERLVGAPDGEGERLFRMAPNDALQLLEARDGLAVHRQDPVTRDQAGRFGRAARLHLADLGRRERSTDGREQQRQRDHRKDEVGKRAGDHDRHALPHALRREAVRVGQGAQVDGRAGRIGVAMHLHVAAKRHGAHFPARTRPVGDAEQLGAESDREHLNPDSVQPRDHIVAELVHEHDHREDNQEGNDVGSHAR